MNEEMMYQRLDAVSCMHEAALQILYDQCPPDPRMYLCRMQDADEDGSGCYRCWSNYLAYLATFGTRDPYRCARRRDE